MQMRVCHGGNISSVSAAPIVSSSSPAMEEPPVLAWAPPPNQTMPPPEEGTPVGAAPPLCSSRGDHRGTPGSAAEKTRKIGAYAVQCARCFKLRLIPTEEEYEVIRHNLTEYPWVCSRRPNVTCGDPADLDFDATSLWIVDKPNIPKTPAGCKRIVTMRKDLTKLDACYIMPNGKRMRSLGDVERFLEAYPEYKGQFSVPDFRFTVPKVMEGMFPGMPMEKASTSTKKGRKKKKMEDSPNVNHDE